MKRFLTSPSFPPPSRLFLSRLLQWQMSPLSRSGQIKYSYDRDLFALHGRPFMFLVTLQSTVYCTYRLSPTSSFPQRIALSHFKSLHLNHQYHLTHPSVSYTGSWHDRAILDLSQYVLYPAAASGTKVSLTCAKHLIVSRVSIANA